MTELLENPFILIGIGTVLGVTLGLTGSSIYKEWKEKTPDQKKLEAAVKEVGLYAVTKNRKKMI